MLGFDSGVQSVSLRAGTRPSTMEARGIAFGGIAIDLLGDRTAAWPAHDDEEARFVLEAGAAATVARVTCAVSTDASLPERPREAGDVVLGVTRGRGLALDASAFRAEVVAVGPRRYAASARIAPGWHGLRALLRGLGACVLEREGGLTLHAAGVVLGGRAVLYLGPSGAGKSTAARLSDGARAFADDHVALVPSAQGWMAWGLPGGSPAGIPSAAGVVFPLGALLRVHQGDESPAIEWSSGASALFTLRAAVESSNDSPDAEGARLAAATRVASEVDVGTIYTVLGRPLMGDLLRSRRVTPRATGDRSHPA
jgi:hypothetical protein